ncbi:hypothetical protein OSG_eHP30_00065 [environmental Halophage eHP-30]|nr:hypothetical protein OSG_eHP30_00065 [environmental Halophage eHP-30]
MDIKQQDLQHQLRIQRDLCDHQLFELGHMKEQAREQANHAYLVHLVQVQEQAAATRAAIDQAINEISNATDSNQAQ